MDVEIFDDNGLKIGSYLSVAETCVKKPPSTARHTVQTGIIDTHEANSLIRRMINMGIGITGHGWNIKGFYVTLRDEGELILFSVLHGKGENTN